jgi:hypothetical protein
VTIPPDTAAELLNLHLATHTLFLPARHRELPDEAVAAIYERRLHYQRFGLTDAPSERDDKQQRSRFRRAMQTAGWLRLRGIGNAQGVKLTPRGYLTACCLAPGWAPWHVYPLLQLVAVLADAGLCHRDGGYVLENRILDSGTSDIGELTGLEDKMTPLIVLGLVEAMSDTVGRLGYRLTPAGRRQIDAGSILPPEDAPPYDASVADQYIADWTAATIARKSWLPSTTNDIAIPLSAGLWGSVQEGADGN